jgi:hypothetical protein
MPLNLASPRQQHFARSLVAAAAALFALAATPAGQQIDDPRYAAWASFKVGSTSTLSGNAKAGPIDLEINTKSTLIAVTTDHVTLKTISSTVLNGQQRPTETIEETVPAKIESEDQKDDGQGIIQAAGRTFKCEIFEGATDAPEPGAPKSGGIAKAWISKEVPGGIVKLSATGSLVGPNGERSQLNLMLQSFEAK